MRKRTNSRRRLLYRLLGGRLLGGRLVLGPTHYKIPKRMVKFPVILVVAANCLWNAPGPWAWLRENY